MIDSQRNEHIEMDEVKIAALMQASSEFHDFYSKAMSDHIKMEIKLIDDLLNFGYKIIQVIGIVAGFGFTAVGAVKNFCFFITGESLFLLTIAYGIYQVKKIYAKNLEGIQKSGDEKKDVFDKKSKVFQKFIKDSVEEGKISYREFKNELNAADKELLKVFSTKEKIGKKDEGRFLNVMIGLLITGGVLLLLSFVSFDFSKVLELINELFPNQ